MKKIIAFVLAFVIVFSCVSAFSEETDGYRKALATVKNRIGNTNDYDEFSGHVNSDETGTVYNFNWSRSGGYMSVSVSEGGIIISYDSYSKNSGSETAISERLTKAEALSRAEELFSKLNPTISDKVEFVDCYSLNDGFRFDIIRTENGYRVEATIGVARNLITKIQNIAMTSIKSLILDGIGYTQGITVGTQSDKTKWWLFALCTGIPQITGILAVIPKFLYPLSGPLRNQMYSELMQRRREMSEKITKESNEKQR